MNKNQETEWNLDLRSIVHTDSSDKIQIDKSNRIKILARTIQEREEIKRKLPFSCLTIDEKGANLIINPEAWVRAKDAIKSIKYLSFFKSEQEGEEITQRISLGLETLFDLEQEIRNCDIDLFKKSWDKTSLEKETLRHKLLEDWEKRCLKGMDISFLPNGQEVEGQSTDEIIHNCFIVAQEILTRYENLTREALDKASIVLASRCFEQTKKTNESIHPLDRILTVWGASGLVYPGGNHSSLTCFFLCHKNGPSQIRRITITRRQKVRRVRPLTNTTEHPLLKGGKNKIRVSLVGVSTVVMIVTQSLLWIDLTNFTKVTKENPTNPPTANYQNIPQLQHELTAQTNTSEDKEPLNNQKNMLEKTLLPRGSKPTSLTW